MFLNHRKQPFELLHYTALGKRRALTEKEQTALRASHKGFIGEKNYDLILDETGHRNMHIFRDVFLKIGKSYTQFDSIIIAEDRISLNEIKNYSGEYRFENGNWYRNHQQMSDNPFVQTMRAKNKLQRLMTENNIQYIVESATVFVNDDFRLISDDDKIWKTTVLRNYLRTYFLSRGSSFVGNRTKQAAEIIKNAMVENPYLPNAVDIKTLKLGLYCGVCGHFDLEKGQFHFLCANCGTKESNSTHVLRTFSDFKFLFPDEKMTKRKVLQLADHQLSDTTIKRYLAKFCTRDTSVKTACYKFKFYDFEEAMTTIKDIRYKDWVKIVE
ncbi:nuclease-related domain-containing protein [Jeotgalicoccus marinus]|uniref:nuclease-related domain-containing protein n=1 Tax=Jeotgalicoccus marinus TaxID=516700 RepID=UPI00040F9C3B|nr:nuclease-related domain-containing protein [Jeotgalicoccus marinus]